MSEIETNNAFLSKLESLIKDERDDAQSIALCEFASAFASLNHPGRFVSAIIEGRLCEIAQKIKTEQEGISFEKDAFLHVMTTAYISGGHTRAVEQWIANSPQSQKHSVVLTGQEIWEIPARLKCEVEGRSGELIVFREGNIKEKAASLRKLSSKYEYVILHVHMFDALPLLAYGHSDFQRPVIFFNHADHLFWIGVSIADWVIDISRRGQLLTKTRRGVRKSLLLPIPIRLDKVRVGRREARERLGMMGGQKLVLSIGASYKYNPVGSFDFFKFAAELCKKRPDLKIMVIGPSMTESRWKDIFDSTNGRVIALGVINRDLLGNYIEAADIYVDSFPFGAGTTVLEVASMGVPTFVIENGLTQFDAYEDLKVALDSLTNSILKRLDAETGCTQLETRVVEKIHAEHLEGWRGRLEQVLVSLSEDGRHNVNQVNEIIDNWNEYDINLSRLLGSSGTRIDWIKFRKLSIRNMLKVLLPYAYWKYCRNRWLRITGQQK